MVHTALVSSKGVPLCPRQPSYACNPTSSPPLVPLQVVGFDMVDDESKPERRPTKHSPAPAEWNSKHNCAYSYYAYYIYANLYTLNKFREARGMNTFAFRPHAGEVRQWRWGWQWGASAPGDGTPPWRGHGADAFHGRRPQSPPPSPSFPPHCPAGPQDPPAQGAFPLREALPPHCPAGR